MRSEKYTIQERRRRRRSKRYPLQERDEWHKSRRYSLDIPSSPAPSREEKRGSSETLRTIKLNPCSSLPKTTGISSGSDFAMRDPTVNRTTLDRNDT